MQNWIKPLMHVFARNFQYLLQRLFGESILWLQIIADFYLL